MMNRENKKLQPIEKVILSFGLMALVSVSLLSMHPAPVHPTATPPDSRKVATPPDSRKPSATATTLRQAFLPHPDTIPAPANHAAQKPVTIQDLNIHSENDKYHARATDRDGSRYEIRRDNGEVKELRINGQLIPKEEYGQYSAVIDSIESARRNIKKPPPPPAPPAPIAPPTSETPPASLTPPASITPPTVATPRPRATPAAAPPMPVITPAPPVAPVPTQPRVQAPPPHPPTPEDPMIYAAFQNPYAKSILLDLIRDGLAGDLNKVSFFLDADKMIVNGVRQPDEVYQIYRQKYIQSPGDHMIYSQHYTPYSQGAHCECIHDPDMPYIPAPAPTY